MLENEEMGIEYIPEVAERIRAQKYADLMMDWTFKFVFGPKGKYKEGLISLLNAIIPDVHIRSIEYLPTELQGDVASQKNSILDLRCVSEDGSQFAVEIQNYRQDDFFLRCMAYVMKLFLEQNMKGNDYKRLMPTYVVAILSEDAAESFPQYADCRDQLIFDHTMIERFSGIIAPRTISVIFANTGNFRRDVDECFSDMDRWFFLLKHSTRMKEYSSSFQSEVFRRVMEVLNISSFSQEEFNMYYAEEWRKGMREAQDATQRRIGREEGFEEGKTEGEAKAKREAARKLIGMGVDIQTISLATDLTPEEIERL